MSIAIYRNSADGKTSGGTGKFGVVEPNHLSAPRNGQVYAQLPADSTIKVLENGMFVKYDYAAGKVAFSGNGPFYMVFNEEKLYDAHKQSHRDYAMQKDMFIDGVMTPRVFAMKAGDIFTTNTLADGTYSVGDKLAPNKNGLLAAATEPNGFAQVVAETTLPDGMTPAVKIQLIADAE